MKGVIYILVDELETYIIVDSVEMIFCGQIRCIYQVEGMFYLTEVSIQV